MTTVITVGSLPVIDFAPATVLDEIIQNVRYIMNTTKFSVPLDRDFGIDASFLDMPTEYAKAQLASEIVLAIAKYEPRAAVTDIKFEADIDGILRPKVMVTTNAT